MPFQTCVLWELWKRPFPLLQASRGFSKTSLLGFYTMLRLILNPGVKIVIVGAAFRQSKFVFDVCNAIWQSSPILRDIAGPGAGPRFENDRCSMRIGESSANFLPMGDGQRVRGERAGIILADEFSAQKVDVFENVVSGFAAVSMDPVEKVKMAARRRANQVLGLAGVDDDLPAVPGLNSNQTILAGTCSYTFNHSYGYWKRYKAIIESKGDRRKLEELFGGELPEKFDWRDYCIIRVPCKLLPEDYMDPKHIAKAQTILTKSQYLMEYGACISKGTKVLTDRGLVAIERVVVGDRVLTHRGRFRPVTKVMTRHADSVLAWQTLGFNAVQYSTPEHPFWDGEESWSTIDKMPVTRLASLRELSGLSSVDVRLITDNYMETVCGRIYQRPGRCKLTREQVTEIRSSSDILLNLSRKYKIAISAVQRVRAKKQKAPKNSIPAVIPLDYDFGVIVGYYAAEGSVGARGRSVGFALDGHHDTTLQAFVDELTDTCKRVFGIRPRHYYKDDNTCSVTLNSCLVATLLSHICPGVANTKVVSHDILFSNQDFLRGFVRGYWNGDGHISAKYDSVRAGSASESLLAQVRLALSHFSIGSTFRLVRGHHKAIIRGKTYDCGPVYSVELSGENRRKFLREFYGRDVPAPKMHSSAKRVVGTDTATEFSVLSCDEVAYDGPVFNLEVEEDHSYSLINATVHNCHAHDSEGFYRRSMIEQCVAGRSDNPILLPSAGGDPVHFTASLRGSPGRRYVFGIDPASESDNFAIVVLEVWPDHRRIVYCWTTTRKRHKARLSRGATDQHDFFQYAARKIRDLMLLFPCAHISVDKQGGGVSVMEALGDPARLQPGEVPILPRVVPGDPQMTDRMVGDHLIEIVQFAKADWVSLANNGLKKDLESHALLFPAFDEISVGLAMEDDRTSGRVVVNEDGEEEVLYDTLEDCVMNIEELKEELASIVVTQTDGGRERWDTPESRTIQGKKVRSRKDRYSALLMANMAARSLEGTQPRLAYPVTGGFAHDLSRGREGVNPGAAAAQLNPQWYRDRIRLGACGVSVKRGG